LYASLALNITSQWTFTLTVAVVRAMRLSEFTGGDPDKHVMVAVRHRKRRIFASPHKSAVRDREDHQAAATHPDDGHQTTSYPYLHFNLDDFEGEFGTTKIAPGYHFAVLLTAGESHDHRAAIFRGVVSYKDVMQHLKKKKYRPPFSSGVESTITGSSGGLGNTSLSSASSGGGANDGLCFVPLAARAGRSEMAVTVAEADRKPAPTRSVKSRVFGLFSSSTSDASGNGGGGSGASDSLDGNETLECALTHLSLHIGHVMSVITRGAATTTATENCTPDRPWLLVPETRDQLSEWLVRDSEDRAAVHHKQQQQRAGPQ
jgi:hypothetical protein